MTTIIEFYRDRKGEHRWRAVAENGRIIAVSSEGYKRPSGARRAYAAFADRLREGRVWLEG